MCVHVHTRCLSVCLSACLSVCLSLCVCVCVAITQVAMLYELCKHVRPLLVCVAPPTVLRAQATVMISPCVCARGVRSCLPACLPARVSAAWSCHAAPRAK